MFSTSMVVLEHQLIHEQIGVARHFACQTTVVRQISEATMRQSKFRATFPTVEIACLALLVICGSSFAQPPGGPGDARGPGGGRFGRGGFPGMGNEPSLNRELMRNESFKSKMNITEAQQEQLNEIDMQRREHFRSFPRGSAPGSEEFDKWQAKMKEFEASAINVLTPDQRSLWETRKTELKAEQAAREAGMGNRSDGPKPPGDAPPAVAAPAVPAPPARRMVFSEEKPPEGVAATASFGVPRADSTPGSDSRTNASSPVGSAEPSDEATRLSFNFRFAPWADVLKLFAEAAGLTLDLNDVPPGTFNYFDEKTYTITEALDVLNGYLLPKGYVLIRRDRFLVSLNIDNGIPPSLVPTVSMDELPKRGANELIIVDVPVEGPEVDKIVGEIRELVGPWGKVAAMKITNSLNIMDTGSNIRRIVRLLKSGTPVIGDKETVFRAISLKHISATDAERTVRRLFGLNPVVTTPVVQGGFGPFGFGGGGGGFGPGGFGGFRGNNNGGDRGDRGGDNQNQQRQMPAFPTASPQSTPSPYAGKIQLTADTRTNHLLVTASALLVKVVEDSVKAIDVQQENQNAVAASPTVLKTYLVPGGDPTQVAQTISAIMPGLVAGIDTRSGKIYVNGTPEEHAEVEKLIKTMGGDNGGSVAVINLMRLDPVQATNSLRNLFVTEARPPTIEADSQGRRLLIRGSADQLAQVKILLQDLGETGHLPSTDKGDRGPTRRVPLGAHDPQDMLPLVRQMWEGTGRAPIRIVIPSQGNPVRDRRVPSMRNQDADSEPSGTDRQPATTGPALRAAPVPATSGPSTNVIRRQSILQVSQSGEPRNTPSEVPKKLEPAKVDSSNDEPAAKRSDTPDQIFPPEDPSSSATVKAPPIAISIVGNEFVITGGTTEERDQIEDMLTTLASALPVRTRWTIFYLRSADATDTAQMLERLFPQSNVTAAPAATSGGMLGSLTSGLSTLGRGMMNSTGLGQTLGGANNLRIITDTRANALFVAGPQDQVREVEQMLELLDASELPDSLRTNVPRTIPVEYADVEEVAAIIEDVFKDAMTPPAPQQQQQQNNQRFNPLAMLMGAAAPSPGRKEQGIQLTVGVDRRTSHLIVACNDSLFRQIEGLVKSMDERARDARQTVQIIALQTADPILVQSTLTSLMPKVTVSASRGGTLRRRQRDTNTPNTPQQNAPAPGSNDADLIQRAAQQQQVLQSFPVPGQNGGPGNGGPGARQRAGQGNRGRTGRGNN